MKKKVKRRAIKNSEIKPNLIIIGALILILLFLIMLLYLFTMKLIFIKYSPGNIIYVDKSLVSDCLAGNYDIASRSCTGSDGVAFNSLFEGVNNLTTGDIAYVRGGVFAEYIGPAANGTSTESIIIKNFNGENVNISGVSSRNFAVDLRDKQYIIVDGINIINPKRRYVDLTRAKGCVIQNSLMKGIGPEGGIYLSSYGYSVFDESSYNIIRNNTIYGYHLTNNSGLETISIFHNAHHNLVENNYIVNGTHDAIYIKGNGAGPTQDPGSENPNHNIIRNNIIINPMHHSSSDGYGAHDNFYEKNIILESATLDNDAEGFHLGFINNIFRNNVVIKSGSTETSSLLGGIGISSRINENSLYNSGNNRVYNNIFSYNRGPGIVLSMGFTNRSDNGVCYPYPVTFNGNNSFVNNIIIENAKNMDNPSYNNLEISYLSWIQSGCISQVGGLAKPIYGDIYRNNIIGTEPNKTSIKISWSGSGGSTNLYNLSEASKLQNPRFINNLAGYPDFVNIASNNFSLNTGSIAIDSGDFLTFATNSGTNSASLIVNDSTYFIDGWGIVEGDLIKVGNNTLKRIISINYSQHLITLDNSITWNINDWVSLPYYGAKPDIGAFEYGELEGGYCGNGILDAGEECDDNNTVNGDGCNSICIFEQCTEDINCTDGLFCNGIELCSAGICTIGEINISDGISCTVDSCDEANDLIINSPDNFFCQDGLWCDGTETCSAVSGCIAGTSPGCSDGIICTTDSCSEGLNFSDNTGMCLYDTGACACTINSECDDGNACTDDICNANLTCSNPDDDSNICDDGFYCFVNDRCRAGECIGDARNADDGIACTADSCDELNDNVTHLSNDILCGNGLWCDGMESCNIISGCVAGTAITCDDSLMCTIDSCNETSDSCNNNGIDSDLDGYSICGGAGNDCNDSNFFINPGTTEICDGIDNNCLSGIDEGNGDCSGSTPYCSAGT